MKIIHSRGIILIRNENFRIVENSPNSNIQIIKSNMFMYKFKISENKNVLFVGVNFASARILYTKMDIYFH